MIGASGAQPENHSFRLSGASGPSILVRRRAWPGTAPAVAPVLLQADRQRHQGSQEHVSSLLQLGISHGENEPRIAAQTRKAVSCKVNSPLSPERITVRADRGTPK